MAVSDPFPRPECGKVLHTYEAAQKDQREGDHLPALTPHKVTSGQNHGKTGANRQMTRDQHMKYGVRQWLFSPRLSLRSPTSKRLHYRLQPTAGVSKFKKASPWIAARLAFGRTHVESMDKDLGDVARDRNVREIGGRTSWLVAVVYKSENQSLCREK